MDHFKEVLLDVWREACQHIEIDASAPRLAAILARHLPVQALWVHAFDWGEGTLVPRGGGTGEGTRLRVPGPRPLRPAEVGALREWVRRGRPLSHRAGEPAEPVIAALAGKAPAGNWMVAPLSSEHGAAGVLLLDAGNEQWGGRAHLPAVLSLMEPFAVALENDRRLQELNQLREAAEADQRSVLARLGRDDLIETIIGMDGGLQPVIQRVKLVAGSDVPVLILGETGSGKEVMARAIHERSSRAAGPFLRVNCGAIPPELIDSELFGHEKGAFTGATSSRRGWFERADRGTLLLDEIGELPLPAQVRLLRVLQEGSFQRVGGERTIRVDVRIIAATHRDLPQMVREGRFREDLWYRIAGFPLLLPPLRDRKQDIPALARHFVQRAARRFGVRPLALSPADLDLLAAYHWPGNIRELASVIDRAAILGAGESLEVAKSLGSVSPAEAPPQAHEPGPATVARRPGGLEDAMRAHIESALVAARGRIEGPAGAARALRINPHTLRSRMRKLGIDWSRYRPEHGGWDPA